MRSVSLSRPLLLMQSQRSPDGAGGFSQTEVALGTVWAQMRPMTGRNTAQGGAALSLQRFKITVRAAPVDSPERPRPDQILMDGDRRFLIQSVAELDDFGRILICHAVEEVAL